MAPVIGNQYYLACTQLLYIDKTTYLYEGRAIPATEFKQLLAFLQEILEQVHILTWSLSLINTARLLNVVPFNKICRENSKKTKVFNQQEIIAHTGILTMRNFLLISLQQFDYLFILNEMRRSFNKGTKETLLVVFTMLITVCKTWNGRYKETIDAFLCNISVASE